MIMAEYHIGCGAFGIYAGTLNAKNKNLWQNKTECTEWIFAPLQLFIRKKRLPNLVVSQSLRLCAEREGFEPPDP